MRARNSIAVLGCVAMGTLLFGEQVPVKAPQTADSLYLSTKDGNTAELRQLKTLAGTGNAGAQFSLGVMYAKGEGVSKDAVQVVSWWLKARNKEMLAHRATWARTIQGVRVCRRISSLLTCGETWQPRKVM